MLFIDLGARGGRPRRWHDDPAPRLAVDGEGIPVGDGLAVAAYVSDTARPATFFETRSGGTSSLYRPNLDLLRQFPETGDRYEVVAEHAVTTQGLDAIVAPYADPPYAMKLDVHGSELAILRGATQTLPQTVLIDIEYWFLQVYHGMPHAGSVHDYLLTAGFAVVDMTRYWWTRHDGARVLIFAEAQYIRWDRALPANWACRIPALQPTRGSRFVSRLCQWVDRHFGTSFPASMRDNER